MQVVSQGKPVVTSSSLNEEIANICIQNGIEGIEMPSYAGQDTGYIPAKEKTMVFIPSVGGSHNPNESTDRESIQRAQRVITDVSKELMLERFKERQRVEKIGQVYESKGKAEKEEKEQKK